MALTKPASALRRFGVALFFSATIHAPPPAQVECSRWDVHGTWNATQSNIPGPVSFTFEQDGEDLRGRAKFVLDMGSDKRWIYGSADGTIKGEKFSVNVFWDHDGWTAAKAIYRGTIGSRGRLEGSTHDAADATKRARFYSATTFPCLPEAAAPRPVIGLGKVKPLPGTVTGPQPVQSICESARSARARNSPAAPGLERQCRATGGTPQ